MRSTKMASAIAFISSFVMAVVLFSDNPTYYTRSCHVEGYPALRAKTWVHVNDNYHTYTRPWAKKVHTTPAGHTWRFGYFMFNNSDPRGYEHPYYRIRHYGSWITVFFVNEHGRYKGCDMVNLHPVRSV